MNIIKKVFFGALAILTLASCEKELNQNDPALFSDANAFLNMADVQLGTNAAYGRYGAYLNDIYTSALTSDEAKIGAGNNGQGALTYRYQYTSDATAGGDVTAAYGAYYSMIDQINRVLPNVLTVPAAAGEEPRRNILRGQLLALRGIAYLSLLELYSPRYSPLEPLGVQLVTVSNPTAFPARSTQAQVLTQIEADLATAKGLLPTVTSGTFFDTTMNRVNIAAYQARVALYKQEFASAIGFATEVISSNVKPISTGAAFANIWTDAGDAETLFRIRYATSVALGGLFTTTGGLIYIAPSDKLVASYSASDIRRAAYIGTVGSDNFVNKYFQSSRGGRVVDMKCIRISEMYLIRAEAYAKLSSPNLAGASADINLIRANRISGASPVNYLTSALAIDDILLEKFRELAFEGLRFKDLKRNNLPVMRLATDAGANWQTLPASSHLFTYPIPISEILANPNVVPNPGY